MSAFDKQIAGDHYKNMKIQPFVFCRENNIPAAESEAIKYIVRHKQKGARSDILKAIHILEMILESDYQNELTATEIEGMSE